VNADRDEWWVLDPDYGVVIPHDIDIIEKNPKIIRSFYAQAGYKLKTIASLGKIYEKKGNVVRSEQGAKGYRIKRFRAEHIFYYLKWIIPCIFVVTSILLFFIRRRNINM
jgi:hypothetical protein